MHGIETLTGKKKGTKDWKGKGRVTEDLKGKWQGNVMKDAQGTGRETVQREVLLNKPHGEVMSYVPLPCRYRRKCNRQTQTRKANKSWYILSKNHHPL